MGCNSSTAKASKAQQAPLATGPEGAVGDGGEGQDTDGDPLLAETAAPSTDDREDEQPPSLKMKKTLVLQPKKSKPGLQPLAQSSDSSQDGVANKVRKEYEKYEYEQDDYSDFSDDYCSSFFSKEDEQEDDRGFVADTFSIGKKLGEGTFGVVFEATRWEESPEKVYALKYIEKAGQSYDSIMMETKIVRELDHPNVVKCFEVIEEPAFTCVVMEKWDGCDVVARIVEHTKAEEDVPEKCAINLLRQFLQAVAYLHDQQVVHRDVKCDNFLTDRPTLVDEEVCVALADFGCACYLPTNKRLNTRCGTRVYKSPEMILTDYSHKADVWACGIALHVVLMGYLPYRDERSILVGPPPVPDELSKLAAHSMRQLLHKNETLRPSAQEALSLPWLTSQEPPEELLYEAPKGRRSVCGGRRGSAHAQGLKFTKPTNQARESMEAEQKKKEEKIAHEEVDEKVHKRREMVLARALCMKHNHNAHVRPVPCDNFESHTIMEHKQASIEYEWWEPERFQKEGRGDSRHCRTWDKLSSDTARLAESRRRLMDLLWTPDIVRNLLVHHDIDVEQVEQGPRNVEKLVHEVRTGEADLMEDATKHNSLVRVVTLVVLMIKAVLQLPGQEAGQGQRLLLVKLASGDGKTKHSKLPSARPQVHETVQHTAERLASTFGLRGRDTPQGVELRIQHADTVESQVSPASSTCVLPEVTRRYVVPGELKVTDATQLDRLGLQQSGNSRGSFHLGAQAECEWWTEERCKKEGIHVPHQDQATSKRIKKFSAIVPALRPVSEGLIANCLISRGLDPQKTGLATKMAPLAEELACNEAFLCLTKQGKCVRVCHVILLHIEHARTGKILMEARHTCENGHTKETLWLPGGPREPHEELVDAVRRIVTQNLQLDFDAFRVLEDQVKFQEEERESHHFPGLPTLYRKHVVWLKAFDTKAGAVSDEKDAPVAPKVKKAVFIKMESKVSDGGSSKVKAVAGKDKKPTVNSDGGSPQGSAAKKSVAKNGSTSAKKSSFNEKPNQSAAGAGPAGPKRVSTKKAAAPEKKKSKSIVGLDSPEAGGGEG